MIPYSQTPVEWSTITNDVKRYIIGFLDYESRCNMRLCSKSDYSFVSSISFKANRLSISEVFSEMDINTKTIIRCDIDSFTIWFIGKENVTRVDRAWNGELIHEFSEIKHENRYDLYRRFLDNYHNRFGITHASTISIVLFPHAPSPNWRIKCDNLTLYGLRGGYDVTWLNQCISRKFNSLEIAGGDGTLIEVNDRMLDSSESLKIDVDSNMTDEQLERVKATNFIIRSDLITVNAVKKYLEYYLKNRRENDRIEIFFQLPRDYDFSRLIPESVIFRKLRIPEYSSSIFRIKLTGFQNENGFNEPQDLRVRFTPDRANITCETLKRGRSVSLYSLDKDDEDSEYNDIDFDQLSLV
ncbi:hypothetical protein GCK72_001126 [Caenorhabditis remanei]|uniref:F-box domain-containing protein n=1 Tax=Caenorhabditis remanei TaxID=31234 RepID=A0A6A5HNS4_CAERE|nr:hypothetical protein GCK72_001126 [Caenorhabditis remanei]KAF1769309.1 hypothetical protein GCK72_001126 [Caenorhabditis remanei]